MFVLVHKNQVISGPSGWNYAMFNVRLQDENIVPMVPRQPVPCPFIINEETRILECDEIRPEFNEKIQYLEGPFINDISGDRAVIEFKLREKPIDSVKFNLKQEVAAERYKKEVAGTIVTIQGRELFVDTGRDARNIFVQKLMLMGDNDVSNWKFPDGFIELTKSELQQIVIAGAIHIQQAFDWEKSKCDNIDACTTLTQLNSFVI